MNARETKTPEQLAVELMTSAQSMKNGEPDAQRLLHELQRNWLHEAARLMESAGYDDDAINWLDAYADYDPAGEAASSEKDITAGLAGLFERLGPPDDEGGAPLCTHCKGDRADPEDPGDYDTTVHMHNPGTRGPCPECNGTGRQPTS